jgi:hypothetical protein
MIYAVELLRYPEHDVRRASAGTVDLGSTLANIVAASIDPQRILELVNACGQNDLHGLFLEGRYGGKDGGHTPVVLGLDRIPGYTAAHKGGIRCNDDVYSAALQEDQGGKRTSKNRGYFHFGGP